MLKLLASTQHAAIRDNSSVLLVNVFPFGLFFLFAFRYSGVIWKFLSAGARPTRIKNFARTVLATFFGNIVILIGMFAVALEILRAVNWNVIEVIAFASGEFALDFIIGPLEKIMVLVHVITEAFIGGADDFTSEFIAIVPSGIHSIFGQCGVILLIFLVLFFPHQDPAIVPNQITVLDVGVDVVHSVVARNVIQIHFI